MEQGSEAWLLARCGKVTASRVADVIAKTKTGVSASRANYMAELLCERLTGCPAESFVSPAMLHGIQQEPFARQAYAQKFDVEVFEIGFMEHPEIAMAGASPDGLVGDCGLVEIKAPNTATHLETLLGGGVPQKYMTQMQFQMAVAGREWCDFVSWDPRLPEAMQMHVERVPRDVSMILNLEHEVAAFIRELDAKVATLRSRYDARKAA